MSEEIKNESAVITDESKVEAQEEMAATQESTEQPKQEKKKVRASGNAKYLTSNRHLAITEGFDKHGDFIMHELQNMLIFGAHGTGKSVIVNNIISQLVMQYGVKDVLIMYFSNKGSSVQPLNNSIDVGCDRVGLAKCDICIGSIASDTVPVIDILEQAMCTCAARVGILMANGVEDVNAYKIVTGRSMAKLVYVLDVNVSKYTSPVVDGYLTMIASMAEKVGVYIILTACDGVSIPYVLYDKFPIRVYTGGSRKNLHCDILGGNDPGVDGVHVGNAWLYTSETSINLFKVQVPYYRRSVLKKIVSGEVWPCNLNLKKTELQQLAVLYQL